MTILPDTGFTPSAEDRSSLEAWFAEYDAASARRDIERMADMAVFPLNLVSDDLAGDGRTAQWDRARFVETMSQLMGDGGDGEMSFESTRAPVFLSPSMAVVFTDSTMTTGGEKHQLRYADILVRRKGTWAFQTMIQSGWGDGLA
ncbi:nuclear transport factor 2 family protein [Streptomyces sp. NPDC049837]|uniref:nuclear transport factor 2 family protein n=1 Tax=Streptomyces sp. NPDC049837 TaxID=3155277 RepID=UPI00342CD66B